MVSGGRAVGVGSGGSVRPLNSGEKGLGEKEKRGRCGKNRQGSGRRKLVNGATHREASGERSMEGER